ncbi:MAG: class I adenylate-forming enzyme family protein [Acutalibacteraceae bacterium]|nr:class I adenylate-forming enzyme family protein [Acutalibacteraceae bacterium]
MTIVHLLERNAKDFAQDTALIEINPDQPETRRRTWSEYDLVEPTHRVNHYRREITWEVFNEKANRCANMLLQHGIGKGKKVAILLMNCIDWLPLYFGILKAGALAVPLNFRYSSDEIDYCLDLAEADVLVFGSEFIGRVEAIADKLSRRCMLIYLGASCPAFSDDYNDLISECSGTFPACTLEESDDAAIYFSSGTTGFPKAILHNHESLIHSCRVEQNHHGQTKDDCFLCIPPLYHTGAKMHWFGSLLTGSKAVILKGTQSRNILEAVSQEKCTIVWLLVPWAQDILNSLDSGELRVEDFELSQWRLMHIGAQPVPQSLIKRWLEYFPDQQYDTNYGLSESIGPGAVHLGVENVHKVGAIGVAGYGWEVKIVTPEGAEVERGSVGELCLKGPGVMTCYYRDSKATADTIRDGWLYTGDMAMQDEDGFIYLVDRKKDVIITGGENLYPVQIENFLSAHPKIKDVAVIGLPDTRLGEIAAAIIEIKKDVTCSEEEINEFCLDLPRYKRPRKIIFADVPRNPTGKIEKPKLRKIYGGEGLVDSQNKS